MNLHVSQISNPHGFLGELNQIVTNSWSRRLDRKRSRKSAYDFVKIINRGRKQRHKSATESFPFSSASA